MPAPIEVHPAPEAVGEVVAELLLSRFDAARAERRRFLLGCPTGRTPGPILRAMRRRLRESPRDLSHVTLVMMDEYLVQGSAALAYASPAEPWSCHHYVEFEYKPNLSAGSRGVADAWFPEVSDPGAYDRRIADAGGIDLFLLASGSGDGHVAFNPPGSPRDSRTRIIPLSEQTRRDNLQTFPAFGTLDAVPRYGVSVGIQTIVESREAIMVVWGTSKRVTLERMRAAVRYDPTWPATLVHECSRARIVADADAAGALP